MFAPEWVEPMAETLGRLGTERAWVVHGLDGIDELSIAGPSKVCEVLEDGTLNTFEIHPSDAGLGTHPLSALESEDVAGNALAITELLDGHENPFRETVLLNAAAGLHVHDKACDLKEGAAMAAEAIDSGKAKQTLRKLVKLSRGEPLE